MAATPGASRVSTASTDSRSVVAAEQQTAVRLMSSEIWRDTPTHCHTQCSVHEVQPPSPNLSLRTNTGTRAYLSYFGFSLSSLHLTPLTLHFQILSLFSVVSVLFCLILAHCLILPTSLLPPYSLYLCFTIILCPSPSHSVLSFAFSLYAHLSHYVSFCPAMPHFASRCPTLSYTATLCTPLHCLTLPFYLTWSHSLTLSTCLLLITLCLIMSHAVLYCLNLTHAV